MKGHASVARGGFTLVEMLVVIVIIGILAALVSGVAVQAMKTGKQTALKSELDQILSRLQDKVIQSTTRIRQAQRKSLEIMKKDLQSNFHQADQLITSNVQPLLEKLNTGNNNSIDLKPSCIICAKVQSDTDAEDTFNKLTALIPCGHTFCHDCSAYAYEHSAPNPPTRCRPVQGPKTPKPRARLQPPGVASAVFPPDGVGPQVLMDLFRVHLSRIVLVPPMARWSILKVTQPSLVDVTDPRRGPASHTR